MWKKIATTSMSVFRNLDCLSLVVCPWLFVAIRLKWNFRLRCFYFFSKFCASKSGVRLIYGCGLYTDVYGIMNDNFFTFIKVCGAPDTCPKLCSNLGWSVSCMGQLPSNRGSRPKKLIKCDFMLWIRGFCWHGIWLLWSCQYLLIIELLILELILLQ